MGWSSAGQIFDPVARALIEAGASDDLKRKTLSALIGQLQEGDWDTEDASLDEFADDPAIVQAFRDNGVILRCDNEDGPADADVCELEVGHWEDHKDYDGRTWPKTVGEGP